VGSSVRISLHGCLGIEGCQCFSARFDSFSILSAAWNGLRMEQRATKHCFAAAETKWYQCRYS
jgi:hypothetical protein